MKPSLFLLGLSAVALIGCGKKIPDSHAGHNHDAHGEQEKSGAAETTFKPGVGLSIPAATRAALGLATAPAEERSVPLTLRVNVQVFAAGPPALASVAVTAAQAATLAGKTLAGARLVKIAPQTTTPDGPVDLVLALDDRSGAKPGDFVELTLSVGGAPPVLAVPRSALLRSAGGTFVYVVNGGAFLRTAVIAAGESADHTAIADGLYAGDEVVTHPVEQLWLIELRATKGGGHSH
jgi:hypothetical protein